MKWDKKLEGINVNSYYNGYRKTFCIRQAYEKLWQVYFGWILKTDWYLCHDDHDHPPNVQLGKTTGNPARNFAFQLLTRGSLALDIDSQSLKDEYGDAPSRGNFNAMACRFSKLFRTTKPAERLDILDDNGRMQPAYRMQPDYDWLIMIDLEADIDCAEHEFPWPFFTIAPNELEQQIGDHAVTLEALIDIVTVQNK